MPTVELAERRPKAPLLGEGLRRGLQTIDRSLMPAVVPITEHINDQVVDNFSVMGTNGTRVPYTRISLSELINTVFPENGFHGHLDTSQKVVTTSLPGFQGNLMRGIPEAVGDMFRALGAMKRGVDVPDQEHILLGYPLNPGGKVSSEGPTRVSEEGFMYHAEEPTGMLSSLHKEGGSVVKIVHRAHSMGTYVASHIGEALQSLGIEQELHLNHPPGSFTDNRSWTRWGGRLQMGVGFSLESALQHASDILQRRPAMSTQDRQFFEQMVPLLQARGIDVAEPEHQKALKRALMLQELVLLGRRPPLPKTDIPTYITDGAFDLVSSSPRRIIDLARGITHRQDRDSDHVTRFIAPLNHGAAPYLPEIVQTIKNAAAELNIPPEQIERYLYNLEGEILDRNWAEDHTRPSVPHYDHLWLWDSALAARIYNGRGVPERAVIELSALLNGVDPMTGFLANYQFRTGRNWRDLESLTFNEPGKESSYSQPPIMAWAAWDTYQTLLAQGKKTEGKQFLQKLYGEDTQGNMSGLRGAYAYFDKNRRHTPDSALIAVIHPHETGRDSDRILKPDTVQLPTEGTIINVLPGSEKAVPLLNTLLDYGHVLGINVQAKQQDWDPEKMKDVYWMADVMFNTLYANNLEYMAEISDALGKKKEAGEYKKLAKKVEAEIIDKMWNEKSGFYYNLDANGKQVEIPSITGLFPLTLASIPEAHVEKLADKLEDPNWFNTEYPIPSMPTHVPGYDPHYQRKRLWDGEVWINANQLIAEEGLVKQIQRKDLSPKLRQRLIKILANLVDKTETLVNKDLLENGTTHEFYDPDNGKGYRIEGFTWSLGGRHLTKSKALLRTLAEQGALT